jgi:VWFA-related protein
MYVTRSIGHIKSVCVVFIALSLPVSSIEQRARQRIHVIAVHDSSLFTLCAPPLWEELAREESSEIRRYFNKYTMHVVPDGRLVMAPLGAIDPARPGYSGAILPPPFFDRPATRLELPRPDWRDLSRMVPGISPSGWSDPQIKKEIEAELRKHKQYALVESLAEADLVFLAEGLYNVYGSNDQASRISYSADAGRFAFARQVRSAVIGVVVPSELYRQHPTDANSLLEERFWAGVSLAQMPPFSPVPGARQEAMMKLRSASPKQLAEAFVDKKKWPDDVPRIYPAWAMRTDPSIPGRSSAEPMIKTGTQEAGSKLLEQAQSGDKTHTIKVRTTLVSVPVIATDINGKYVSGLTHNDLRVYEEGVEQEIDAISSESAAFQTALLLDTSRSTSFARSDIETAAAEFVDGLRSDDALMVVSVGNRVNIDSELATDKDLLHRAIKEAGARAGQPYFGSDIKRRFMDSTRGTGTRLYDAIDMTLTERMKSMRGRKAMLLFTDGIDIGSRLANAASTLARIEESDVIVYVLRYNTPVPKTEDREAREGWTAALQYGREYLQQITGNSGGRILDPSTIPTLHEAFSTIAEELRNQYTLYYYPSNPSNDGSFRRIRVTVEKPGVKLRFRSGYRMYGPPATVK